MWLWSRTLHRKRLGLHLSRLSLFGYVLWTTPKGNKGNENCMPQITPLLSNSLVIPVQRDWD